MMATESSDKDKNTSEEKQTEAKDNSSLLDTLLQGLMEIPAQAVKMASGTPLTRCSNIAPSSWSGWAVPELL